MQRQVWRWLLFGAVALLLLWVDGEVLYGLGHTQRFFWLWLPFLPVAAATCISVLLCVLGSPPASADPAAALEVKKAASDSREAYFFNAPEKGALRLGLLAMITVILVILIAREVDPSCNFKTPVLQFAALFLQRMGSH